MSPDFDRWMADVQARIESGLSRRLPAATTIPSRLHDAMRYATLGGGKRVRPLLAFAAGEVGAADPDRVEAAACAVELIHAYSLVHDDLPCMDDDDLRRGRPSCHVEYDEATALLVGDSLQALAFEVLAAPAGDPAGQLEMIRLLAQASGSCGMAGGQAIDLESVGRAEAEATTPPELELMHLMKTGALIRAAVQLGARCGNGIDAETLDRLDRFAKRAGLLFQVVDDILDCTASTATLGKTAGKDAAANKPTYVSVMGLAAARDLAGDLRQQALDALAPLGDRAGRLVALTRFIADRKF